MDSGWMFTQKPVADPFIRKYDDGHWEKVNLPHCFNVNDPYDDDDDYYRGTVWYRKSFSLDKGIEKEKKYYLCFDGSNLVSDVYVNGAFAGRHEGGYTAFQMDITSFLKNDDKKNVIAVKVDNSENPFVAPLHVGYTIYGGIYRHVRLIATNEVHFNMNNYGSSSVFVSTPEIKKENASVLVNMNITNETNSKKVVKAIHAIYDKAGAKVFSNLSDDIILTPGSNIQKNIYFNTAITNPHYWSPEDPYLYKIVTQITDGQKILDEQTNAIGVRTFRFTADSGFFLNGKKYVLKGTNRHQDKMGKGSALSYEDHELDLQSIKNMGCNFLRLAHYPQDPYVLKRADEIGLLLWEEIPLVDYMNINTAFRDNCANQIREMIRQHYNHPSIIMWGSMNEIFLQDYYNERAQKQTDSLYGANVHDYAVYLDSVVRAEDPYRSSTMAMHMSSDYDKFKIDVIPQVASYNIYNGWYSGKVEEFGKTFDKKHEAKPNQRLFISEYGAESDKQVNTEKPTRLDNTGQYQRYFHESYLSQIKQRNYFNATCIWNQFDFGNPGIGGTISNINHKGMYSWDRKPKDIYYMYKANWNPEPMVYIATKDWPQRATAIGDSSVIDVYTNSKEVSLWLNGKKLSAKKTNDVCKASWKVVLANGRNILIAKTKNGKGNISDTSIIENEVYDLNLQKQALNKQEKTEWRINVGSDAQYIDENKKIWIEDRPYQTGSFGYISGKPSFISLKGKITKTDKTQLLYTYLDSVIDYRLDVPNGSYEVDCYFAEPELHSNGKRIFDVMLNGELFVSKMDLHKEEGYCVAVKKNRKVTVKDNQGIQLHFNAIKGKPLLNGIHVKRIN